MATYYVYPQGGGSNQGTQANPWTSFATAISTAVAGDIVLCRGYQNLASSLGFVNSGDETSGPITFIGVNASWVEEGGVRFGLNGQSAITSCLQITSTINYIRMKNFEIYGATSHGITGGSQNCNAWLMENCVGRNNGGIGLHCYHIQTGAMIRCMAYGNGSHGLYTRGNVLFCSSFDNSGVGLDASYMTASAIFGCLFFDNTTGGIGSLPGGGLVVNSVLDGNSVGGMSRLTSTTGRSAIVIGSRFTNQTFGLDANSELTYVGWNYFGNNTNDYIDATLVKALLNPAGSNTNILTGSDTLQGYTDDDPEDFDLTSGASLRRTAITIPTS